MTLSDQHRIFVANMTDGIRRDLADLLGCTLESIIALEVGFYPGKQVWTFPERDAEGQIIGITTRTWAGHKFMIPGSQRGLTYVCTKSRTEPYNAGAKNWVRCTTEMPCPICGRIKYCLLSADNPLDPGAVLCTKIEEGSDPTYHSADGQSFLHILKEGARRRAVSLPPSDEPVFIVEGPSDVLAAESLGLVAIGKPNSRGGHAYLEGRVGCRPAIVMGENDGGEGEHGMRNTHALLIRRTKTGMLMPPAEFKDLRQWYVRGSLTNEKFLEYVSEHAEWPDNRERIFEHDDPLFIAQRWIEQCHTINHTPTLRYHMHRWVQWDGSKYVVVSPEAVKGGLYNWLGTCKLMVQVGCKIEPRDYMPNKARVGNIFDASTAICPVDGNAPQWLIPHKEDLHDIVVFKNGILNTRTFEMEPCTPDLFSYNGLPFDYDPDADYTWWANLVSDILGGDKTRIRLLQQWFGYNMVCDTSQEKLMIFLGLPRSGKGTITEALKTVLGPHQVGSTDLDSLAGPFGYESLLGKLAVTVGDLKTCRETSIVGALERILNITGADGVSVNIKGKPAIPHVYLPCRFTISMNMLPALYDHANALMPRLLLLQFPNSYMGREDRSLKSRISKEGQAIAAWSLKGLIDLRSSKKFVETGNDQLLHDFRRLNSPMTAFVEDCCEVAPEHFELESIFYYVYKAWCKGHFINAVRGDLVKQRLCTVYPQVKLGPKAVMDSRIFGWRGIQISAAAKKEYGI